MRRPKGVGRGAAELHEVGTDTRNEYRKSMLKSRWLAEETAVFIAEEGKRAGPFSIRC